MRTPWLLDSHRALSGSGTWRDRLSSMPPNDDSRDRTAITVGLGLVFGAAAGAAVFALTGYPVWIGLGSGAGLVVGAVLGAHPTDSET